ncbi:HNH endonuclease signature motif containing protein [Naasia sp. SYSU D00948]|uniref:HNH endonuclease n=1 Tax=Naasia sp. SYSU D00948 TaxID=2817379 RepID=UPI001B30BE08|nr:HNH endonuclease signature motif containing protein [Naasia sp. SYSU D00948]
MSEDLYDVDAHIARVCDEYGLGSPLSGGSADLEESRRLVESLQADRARQAAQAARRLRTVDELRLLWERTRGASMALGPHAIAFRSLRAQVASALGVREATAETMLWTARALVHELPATLRALEEGRFSERHARILALAAADLDPEQRTLLERRALPHAAAMTPAKFEQKVRMLSALLEPEKLAERARTAKDERDLVLEPGRDGMAWLHLHLPAEDAVAGFNFADETARRLQAEPGETRTLPQLRADVVRDLVLDGAALLPPAESGSELREQTARPRGVVPTVHVTAPALALSGSQDLPSDLDGYGPIDPETARRLCGAASGFYRILTDPGTGAVVQFGRERYEVPPELRRFLKQRDGTCRFVGCSRPAKLCDIDHTVPWEDGGETEDRNLAYLCRGHHRVKHRGGWSVRHDPDRPGVLIRNDPDGFEYRTEPRMVLTHRGERPAQTPARHPAAGMSLRVQTEWADDPPPF